MPFGNPPQRFHRSARPHRNRAASGPEPWMRDAACAGAGPELFFPGEQRDPASDQARRACARCQVRAECLDYSVRTREEFGTWGGLDEGDRRAVLDGQGDGGSQGVA